MATRRAAASPDATSSRARRAAGSSSSPAAVSDTRPGRRSNSGWPTRSSNRRIC
ncbi:hypothetical protein ACFQ1I_10945 [Kitasatospora arboriphila]